MRALVQSTLTVAVLASVGGLASPPAARATTVQFYDSGSFTAGSGESATNYGNPQLTVGSGFNTLNITYYVPNLGFPTTLSSSNLPQTVSIGSLSVNDNAFGGRSSQDTFSPTGSFSLTITQTKPTSSNDTGTYTAALGGSISGNTSNGSGSVTFNFGNAASTQFTIDNITYQLTDQNGNPLTSVSVNVSGGSGSATLYATVSDPSPAITTAPEPSTLAMAGMGGLTLLAYGWRRRSGASEHA